VILWLALGAITALTVWMLLRPILRRGTASPPRADYDLEVYRDQLDELKREVGRGVIAGEEAQAAEREIARRLLAAAVLEDRPIPIAHARPDASGGTSRRWATFGIVALMPIAAFVLYLAVGAPGLPDYPFAARPGVGASAGMPEIGEAIARLEARLKETPDDREGWSLLARTYAALSRFKEAADAYRHVVELSGERPDALSAYAEMRVMEAHGQVGEEARTFFEKALAKNPGDARAVFYLGLAKAQSGDGEAALRSWLALEATAPADAPWLPALKAEIDRVAKEYKLDPAKLAPANTGAAASPGPTSADVAAAQNMSPEARAQMIRSMVERLAARLEQTPDDLEGWRRLGKAYRVLDEPAKAAQAFSRAAKLAPQDPDVLAGYGDALFAEAGSADVPPAESVDVMRQVLTLDGKRPEALWVVGLADAAEGKKAEADMLWKRLLAELDPGTPQYERVKARLEALDAAP
jgi:cytochrome c-type biogenesis protein CcmH